MRAGLAALLGLLFAAPSAHAAVLFYGVTESNRLVSFASDSPGNILSSVPISGLLENEHVLGIDLRPANGRLYGLGSANRLYEIDAGSGRANPVGPLFDVAIRGSGYGFDFDPSADVARVVSDAELNMRLSPEDGRVVDHDPSSPSVQPDTDLTWAPGDPNAGQGLNVTAIAYTREATPRLFGLDTGRDALVRIDPPNDGVVRTVGALGVDAGEVNGFHIDSSGTPYAVFTRGRRRAQDLMTIDLSSGRARPATRYSEIGTYRGRRPDALQGLTVAGTVADDRARPGLVFTPVRNPTVGQLVRGKPLVLLASCSEACRVDAALYSGRRRVARATGFVRERAGVTTLRLALARRGRAWVRSHPRVPLRLKVRARDAAGNVTKTR